LKVKGLFPSEYPFTIHDTKIMAHLLRDKVPKEFLDWYEEERKRRNKLLPKGKTYRETSGLSLKVLAPWYLKVEPFWETPGDYNNEEYNRKDCEYTYRLFQLFEKKLKDEGSWDFYVNRMLEWSKMVMDMEIKGIQIDLNELDQVEKEYLEKRETYKRKLDEQWRNHRDAYHTSQVEQLKIKYEEGARLQIERGRTAEHKTKARYQHLFEEACKRIEPFNYASSQQMTWLLKEQLGLDITDPEGEETTGKSVLNRLAQERDDIKNLLEYKEADKVLTMYIPTYRELQIDSTIHPSFNLTGTRTGRTSSSGPNLQQVPSKLYRLFKPRSGYKFIQYDLSGIEAALIALYSGDKRLYDILSTGESMHDHNAKALFNLECDVSEVSKLFPKQRKTVKNIGFACFYGAGWRRISSVFAAGGFPISDREAKEKLKSLKAYYPKAFEYHEEITEIFEAGEVVYNLFGRPIKMQPHENCYMQGMNTLIQSSASDLNLRACEKASKKWKEMGLDAYPLLVIHDCIIAEVREAHSQVASDILVNAMTGFKLESENGLIPLRVEGSISLAWEK
jgi:DNA polymerase I-like protein with 3'-5' exonuclease and polymerase domains